jgi:ribonucleoside-triphosphate reductase
MADEANKTEQQQPDTTPEAPTPAAAQNTDTGAQDHMIPKGRFDEINEQLKAQKAEAAKLTKQLKEFQKAQEQTEQTKLEEQGEYAKVKEKLALKVADLEKKLETIEPLQQRITDYEKKFGELLEGQKAGLPDYIQDLLKDRPPLDQLEWINQHRDQLPSGANPAEAQPQAPQPAKPPTLAPVNPTNPARAAIQTGSLTQEHKDRLLGKKRPDTLFTPRPDGVLSNTS